MAWGFLIAVSLQPMPTTCACNVCRWVHGPLLPTSDEVLAHVHWMSCICFVVLQFFWSLLKNSFELIMCSFVSTRTEMIEVGVSTVTRDVNAIFEVFFFLWKLLTVAWYQENEMFSLFFFSSCIAPYFQLFGLWDCETRASPCPQETRCLLHGLHVWERLIRRRIDCNVCLLELSCCL